MRVEFKLPDVGEGVAEADLLRWLVQEGESVAADQPLVEVQTDKAVVELPSPAAGKVLALHGKEGDTVAVGDVLVVIGDGEEEEAGEATKPHSTRRRRVLAAPSTRRLAREMGVDLSQVKGTGPQGRVMDEDVRRFAAADGEGVQQAHDSQAETAPASLPSSTIPAVETAEVREEPLSPIRRVIAERLAFSVTRKPHATHFDTLDVSGLVAWRERLKQAGRQPVGILPVLLKMIGIALRRHPVLNTHYDEERGLVRTFGSIHIGMAADTPRGLLVPVIHHVEQKSIRQLAEEIRQKTEAARKGTLAPEEMRGGTFTVSNAGPLGGQWATPIINPPEVAILALHPVEQRPVVEEGKLTAGWRMNVSLSFDHRVLDGGGSDSFHTYATNLHRLYG